MCRTGGLGGACGGAVPWSLLVHPIEVLWAHVSKAAAGSRGCRGAAGRLQGSLPLTKAPEHLTGLNKSCSHQEPN